MGAGRDVWVKIRYRATTAQWHADRCAKRPKVAKLAANGALRHYVQEHLAGTLKAPNGTDMPATASMYPSAVYIIFNDGPTATIHERDCSHKDIQFQSVDGGRWLRVSSLEVARAVIEQLGKHERRAPNALWQWSEKPGAPLLRVRLAPMAAGNLPLINVQHSRNVRTHSEAVVCFELGHATDYVSER